MLNYAITVQFEHPDIDPIVISNATGWQPLRCWKCGEPRVTPVGRPLPGSYEKSFWVARFEYVTDRAFFDGAKALLVGLEQCGTFLGEFVAGGGSIYMNVNLDGRTNIGDVLDWQSLARLAALKVNLGVEVFPNG